MMDTSSAAENVVPLIRAPWDSVSVRVAPERPRIEPGTYTVASVGLRKFTAFGRRNLELLFEVYAGEPGVSPVLAKVPLFIRLPASGRALSPNSRLAVMLTMLGRVRQDAHSTSDLSVLRHKHWRVVVADTKQDSASGSLDETEIPRYSVVRRVIARA
jgi:hypothetical protein